MKLLSIEEVTETDEPGILNMVLTVSGLGSGIPFTYDPTSVVGIAPEIKQYLIDNPATVIAPYVEPNIEVLREEAKESVIEFSNTVTEPILKNYSESEILGWERKGLEAEVVLKKVAASETVLLTDAPNIVRKLKLQYPDYLDSEILAELLTSSQSIHGKAQLFNSIMDYLEILRVKAYATIDSSTNQTEISTALTAIQTEAVSVITSLGLTIPE